MPEPPSRQYAMFFLNGNARDVRLSPKPGQGCGVTGPRLYPLRWVRGTGARRRTCTPWLGAEGTWRILR